MKGIIKHRYSDFHVNEIDEEGRVVHLTSFKQLDIPQPPQGFADWYKTSEFHYEFQSDSELLAVKMLHDYPDLDVRYTGGIIKVNRIKRQDRRISYCKCVLYKENITMQDAIGTVARCVGGNRGKVGIAGTKDKRGCTTQMITVRDGSIKRLSNLDNEHIKLGGFFYSINPLSLGDSNGNHFRIVIRDVSIPADFNKRIDSLKNTGFINYFGMQRFGTTSLGTHEIGKMVIKRQWKQLVEAILEPLDDEQDDTRRAKIVFKETGDANKALEIIGRRHSAEVSILSAIAKREKGHEFDQPYELFQHVERRQRMLYVHAYQSYLWNMMASERFKKHGLEVVAGDCVMVDGKITALTDETKDRYTILDVVIPIIGSSYIHPSIIPLIAKDGITEEMFRRLPKEYSASGDVRSFIIKPKDFSYKIIHHNDMDEPLIDSDLDVLNGVTYSNNWLPEGEGRITSLFIEFSLQKGSYATMLMRELLKRSTEWWSDAEMSNKPAADVCRCEIQ